tara:strand:- start:1906 stop:2298 length:393 start_codon:yes stop_codon:yes gene_type:complete
MNDNVIEEGSVMTTDRVSSSSYGKSLDNAEQDQVDSVKVAQHVTNLERPISNGKTYIEIVATKDDSGQPMSVLEVDLIISREKGKENRRLAMNFAEIDVASKQIVEKSVNIDRDSFEKLKDFFTNLDWNS